MNRLRKLLVAALSATAVGGYAMEAVGLKCEYVENPVSVASGLPPRLSWVPQSGEADRGASLIQSSYRIVASSTAAKLAAGDYDLWDSGKVAAAATAHIPYGGAAVAPFGECYWKVMLWDGNDRPGAWSAPAHWCAGPSSEADWHGARWIAALPTAQWQQEWDAHKGAEIPRFEDKFPLKIYSGLDLWQIYDTIQPGYDAAPMLRKEFAAPRETASAKLYICGLGYFEAYVNGSRVGDDVLNPAWTIFDRRALYSTYDVTPLIRSGAPNAIGVVLGRGELNPVSVDAWGHWKTRWVSQPKLIAMLRITDRAGREQWLVTDSSWLTAPSPIVLDDVRMGEIYDARLEQPGWSTAGFDAAAWRQCSEVEWPLGILEPQMLPPVRRHAAITPRRRIDPDENTALFDIGEDIAGWARVKVSGPRGARVLVEYCEEPSDTQLVANLHPARLQISAKVADPRWRTFHDATTEVRQQNGYILSGTGAAEEFECHFSYKGFRYVRVTAEGDVKVLGIEGIPVHTDLATTGHFRCSDSTVNRLQEMARRTMENNFMGIPTDCPHREKQGWTADTYFTTCAAMYNYDMTQFYAKWLRDLAGTQAESGALCTVAPSVGYDEGVSVSWPAAMLYVPADVYDFYGEKRLLGELYPAMQRFADYCRTREVPGDPGIIQEVLGDWVSPADSILPTLRGSSILAPPEGVNTYGASSYYSILRHLARIAPIAGHADDARGYEQWAGRVRRDFNSRFLRADENAYYGHQPTPYRLAPNAVALYEGLVPDTLREDVAGRLLGELRRGGYKARTGFLGTRAMMKWLPGADADGAFRFATQPEYPGWGYMAAQGATTMWEDWAGCASHDHIPYALVSEYFYRHLAGINLSHSVDGAPQIEIAPDFPAGLNWAEGSYDSLYGRISTHWERTPQGDITLDVTLPANLGATLRLRGQAPRALAPGSHRLTVAAPSRP